MSDETKHIVRITTGGEAPAHLASVVQGMWLLAADHPQYVVVVSEMRRARPEGYVGLPDLRLYTQQQVASDDLAVRSWQLIIKFAHDYRRRTGGNILDMCHILTYRSPVKFREEGGPESEFGRYDMWLVSVESLRNLMAAPEAFVSEFDGESRQLLGAWLESLSSCP